MWRIALVILTAFCLVSAIAGFLYLGPGGAADWSTDFLDRSPFNSYWWPAVILLVVVGGTQLAALVLLLLRRGAAVFWTATAGFAMVIWIIVEQLMFHVPEISGEWITLPILQSVYAAIGLAELGCVQALLGLFDSEHTRRALRRGPAERPAPSARRS